MKCQLAKGLAAKGFWVYPLIGGTKFPALSGKPHEIATRNPKVIEARWLDPVLGELDYDISIATHIFGEDRKKCLIIVDVDVDVERNINGFDQTEIISLLDEDTLSIDTARGGRHYYYLSDTPVKTKAAAFGRSGIDVRSGWGNVKFHGSVIPNIIPKDIPEKLFNLMEPLGSTEYEDPTTAIEDDSIEVDMSVFPPIESGSRGDAYFKMACRLKDKGLGVAKCIDVLTTWNDENCTPPFDPFELQETIRHAYAYGKRPQGADHAKSQFEPLSEEPAITDLDPVLDLNNEFAFVVEGGKATIFRETTDEDGGFFLERMGVETFHQYMANRTYFDGNKNSKLSQRWISSPSRRTYDRIVFSPKKEVSDKHYNLWRGFTVEPLRDDEKATPEMEKGLQAFLEHLTENVTETEEEAQWLLSYFAHLVQKPYEKPLVAPVICGAKGVGKDSLVDRVGYLLGPHYIMAASPRLFLSNFNAHLEHSLMIVLNEAFWSGDKKADGVLKDLVTGNKHIIERKGKELVTAKNLTRVIIMGNDDWLIPASMDERRFSVFKVGEARREDVNFFRGMRLNMEKGGYRLLLRYLLNYKITHDMSKAINTRALTEQKKQSLEPIEAWWYQALTDGFIEDTTDDNWPVEAGRDELYRCLLRWMDAGGYRNRRPHKFHFHKRLEHLAGVRNERKMIGGDRYRVIRVPSLKECRDRWDRIMNVKEPKWNSVTPMERLGF